MLVVVNVSETVVQVQVTLRRKEVIREQKPRWRRQGVGAK